MNFKFLVNIRIFTLSVCQSFFCPSELYLLSSLLLPLALNFILYWSLIHIPGILVSSIARRGLDVIIRWASTQSYCFLSVNWAESITRPPLAASSSPIGTGSKKPSKENWMGKRPLWVENTSSAPTTGDVISDELAPQMFPCLRYDHKTGKAGE